MIWVGQVDQALSQALLDSKACLVHLEFKVTMVFLAHLDIVLQMAGKVCGHKLDFSRR